MATSKSSPPKKGQARQRSVAEQPAGRVGITEKINLGVALIAAVSVLIGAGLGVGGTVYTANQSASSAKSARAEEALRSACNQNLKVQGQTRDLLLQAAVFLEVGDIDGFQKRLDDFNKLGTNGEAATLFAAAPNDALNEAVDIYVARSDAALTALIQYGAIPQQVRSQESEAAPVRSALDEMRKATMQVGIQCRLQLASSN